MLDYVNGALRVSLVTLAICGFAYPFSVTGVGQLLMPDRANGSLERSGDGEIIGSRLIGQQWSDPQWFHGRPSATMDLSDSNRPEPYNAANTSASNLGPASKALEDRLIGDRKALEEAQPELAGKTLPADVLTASASGLDPDISPANASLQAERVAKARGLKREQVAAFVDQHITPRSLWIFGEPRVNVLALNYALEQAFPLK
ncbi:MAG: potassium-transporting ATPase subunit KdpC [Rhodoblastus sp.]|uniref:potassium-transporting ATPase subunit KdpC n=1 Tax=Rhodoblastus sp. TaxID=1962975 RepID=UPI003F9E8898